jgi:hypothetical protein
LSWPRVRTMRGTGDILRDTVTLRRRKHTLSSVACQPSQFTLGHVIFLVVNENAQDPRPREVK